MPQVPGLQSDEQDPFTSDDPYELEEPKPELWPLLLPSQLSQENRSSCHRGVTETEQTLRLAQMQDSLVDLRRFRRTLRSLRMYFRSNVVGEGTKPQTKSRGSESTVLAQIKRAVRRYRLAYTAHFSLDPTGDWRKEYLELTDKDNRGPGKEVHERGPGDGHYTYSWIWGGSFGTDPSDEEVNETVRHEWMTCRARADRWGEELELLQEEMRRVVVFLEWKSSWWGRKVGSRLGTVATDVQHGIDTYALKQANTYHELAVSLANQWLPSLVEWKLDIKWVKEYPWANAIVHSQGSSSTQEDPSSSDPAAAGTSDPAAAETSDPNTERGGIKEVGANDDSGDESDDGGHPEADGRVRDDGEDSDGLAIGFEYDDEYMS